MTLRGTKEGVAQETLLRLLLIGARAEQATALLLSRLVAKKATAACVGGAAKEGGLSLCVLA